MFNVYYLLIVFIFVLEFVISAGEKIYMRVRALVKYQVH